MSLRVHTVLYDGAEDQDFIGPVAALGPVPEVRHSFVTVDGPGSVTTSSGMEVMVRASWSPESADVILVPGGRYGAGSAVDREVRRGVLPKALADARRPGLVMAGVCTGTLLLSAGGITTGRPCTTHHIAKGELKAQGGRVVNSRVVDDGDLVTSGGVTSGIDLGLWLVERFYGIKTTLFVQEVLEHERRGAVWRST